MTVYLKYRAFIFRFTMTLLAIFIVFHVCFCAHVISEHPFRYHAHRIDGLDDKVFGGIYYLDELADTKSTIECTFACGRQTECMSFAYHEHHRRCRLYKTGLFDPDFSENKKGWKTYNFGDKTCPLSKGFIHSRSDNLCILWRPQPLMYLEHMEVCKLYNATPISLQTTEKYNAFIRIMVPVKGYFSTFIGLRKTGGNWAWENGNTHAYFHWAQNQPDCQSSCNCIVAHGISLWKYDDVNCNNVAFSMVCEHQN